MNQPVRLTINPLRTVRLRADMAVLEAQLTDVRSVLIPADVQLHFKKQEHEDKDVLRGLAETIGNQAALKLCQALGGHQLYIPKAITPDHPIVHAIGWPAAILLSDYYGNERIDLPMATYHLRRLVRARVIATVRQKHITMVAGARLLGIPVRRMREFVNGSREAFKAQPLLLLKRDTRQLDLFVEKPQDD